MIRYLFAISLLFLGMHLTADAATLSPPTLSCATEEDAGHCESRKRDFLKAWPKANSGDYLAQREVAFCYTSGCNGSVQADPIKACTWEIVIVSTEMSDVTDAFNFRQACGPLNSADRNTANNVALRLYSNIYKRLMTKALPYEPPK